MRQLQAKARKEAAREYERTRKTTRFNVCQLRDEQQMQARSRYPVQYMQGDI